MLGLLLHVALGEILGFGSIVPVALLPYPLLSSGHSMPAVDALAWELVILAMLVPYLARRDLHGRAALWIERIDWRQALLLAIAGYLAARELDQMLGLLLPDPGTTPDDDISADFAALRGNPFGFATYAACVTVIGPIVEEFAFRGLLYGHLRDRLGAPVSIGITGLLFGLIHGGPPAYTVSIVVTGIVLGILREWSGGVLTPIAAHILNNALASLEDLFSA